jgi:hypothetical protein
MSGDFSLFAETKRTHRCFFKLKENIPSMIVTITGFWSLYNIQYMYIINIYSCNLRQWKSRGAFLFRAWFIPFTL